MSLQGCGLHPVECRLIKGFNHRKERLAHIHVLHLEMFTTPFGRDGQQRRCDPRWIQP